MLFNSFGFLLGFLPITLVLFYLLGSTSRSAAIRWLIFASLVFYGCWRPLNILIVLPSIVVNFFIASILRRLNRDSSANHATTVILVLGILFNVIFLGAFKYTDFVVGSVNDVFGANLVLQHIILPLGISFITFQKIAFLVDVQAGRVRDFNFWDYCTFVLFFPQLVAGPIVHYREMMPQFKAASCRFDQEDFAVGLTLLIFGLFKKIVFADSIAPYVTPIYDHSATGGQTSFLLAWMAAIGSTLQIYFDFSGYTDMALGLARFFGIRLPQNFNSPLRASSIIDFWLRWHMTLTRFLTAYIYNPLLLWLTRRRLTKGRSGFSGRDTTVQAFLSLLMFPTIVTMFISGLWHGAGYGFVVWGVLHGFFLSVNHGWRLAAARLWPDKARYQRVMKPVGLILTFATVTGAMVFFRAATMASAIDLVEGLTGLHGIALPSDLIRPLGPLAATLHHLGLASVPWNAREFVKLAAWILLLMFIALTCPNTGQILSRYEPALGVRPQPTMGWIERSLTWNGSLPWATAVSITAMVAILFMGGSSEFLYWQF
jgi:alginate O-acetyltransferase complex protein AlgI